MSQKAEDGISVRSRAVACDVSKHILQAAGNNIRNVEVFTRATLAFVFADPQGDTLFGQSGLSVRHDSSPCGTRGANNMKLRMRCCALVYTLSVMLVLAAWADTSARAEENSGARGAPSGPDSVVKGDGGTLRLLVNPTATQSFPGFTIKKYGLDKKHGLELQTIPSLDSPGRKRSNSIWQRRNRRLELAGRRAHDRSRF